MTATHERDGMDLPDPAIDLWLGFEAATGPSTTAHSPSEDQQTPDHEGFEESGQPAGGTYPDDEFLSQWVQEREGIAGPASQGGEQPQEGDLPRRLIAVPASAMAMKVPRWLFELRIPTSAITLLAGREGIGKSTISYDIASKLTRGELVGQYHGTPRSVGVAASEDSWESVILPRLVAAQADLDRIYRIEARTELGRFETISAPADLPALAELCADKEMSLIIIDPIMSMIHSSLDTHKDREVRQALDPLARFAAENEVALLSLIHVNKSTANDPMNAIMGSRAFGAVARSVLYCITDPEAEREDRYLFGHPKSNLGPKQPTIQYHLVQVELPAGEETIATSRVVWDGVDTRSVRDAMEPPRPGRAAGDLATRIEAWVRVQDCAVSTADIRSEFSDTPEKTLSSCLTRMVGRGALTRPVHGMYAVPAPNPAPNPAPPPGDIFSAVSAGNAGKPADTADPALF